jgi:hypothetical protein
MSQLFHEQVQGADRGNPVRVAVPDPVLRWQS